MSRSGETMSLLLILYCHNPRKHEKGIYGPFKSHDDGKEAKETRKEGLYCH